MTCTSGSAPSVRSKYSFCCMPAMFAFAFSMVRRAAVRISGSLPTYPSITITSRSARYASCFAAISSNASRVMVFPLEGPPTTCVLAALREVTWVCTFTLPKEVMRVCGMASVNVRSSSGVGLTWVSGTWSSCLVTVDGCSAREEPLP